MVAIAIGIAAAGDTAAAIGQADRGITGAAGIVRRVAGLTGVGHALTAVAIPVGTTGDAIPRTVILDAERRVLVATSVIVTRVAGAAIAGHTLTRVGVVTVIVGTASDTLVTVLPDDAIWCARPAAFVRRQITGLALTYRTKGLVQIIALEVTLAIAADVSIG